jgi:hypothetical protein
MRIACVVYAVAASGHGGYLDVLGKNGLSLSGGPARTLSLSGSQASAWELSSSKRPLWKFWTLFSSAVRVGFTNGSVRCFSAIADRILTFLQFSKQELLALGFPNQSLGTSVNSFLAPFAAVQHCAVKGIKCPRPMEVVRLRTNALMLVLGCYGTYPVILVAG